MSTRVRTRTVIGLVGTLTSLATPVITAPAGGTIKRVRATCDPTQDAEASAGSGPATDISLSIAESATASGLGGSVGESVPLVYSFTPSDPSLTIDSEECIDYQVKPGRQLCLSALVDAGPALGDAIMVVTLEIEIFDTRIV